VKLSISAAGGETLATSAGVSDALRDLAGAVAAIAEILDRQPAPLETTPQALLREVVGGVGKLHRLLEDAVEPRPGPAPRLPAVLTLTAVSRRTGIPAATLRTWERRYGFVRPVRSARGYRLYGEEEILRILQVKHLREQGVRISEAMAAVAGTADAPRA
jgi:hypothetical protein